jgi:diaminopimelate epimerase
MAEAGLRLTKHHGAGNDFLVLLDPGGVHPLSGEEARALCDRHRGLGADGVLRATPPSAGAPTAPLTMKLRNADGSIAEMSGNGIRCFVQAAVRAGLVAAGPVPVATGAGLRTVDYQETATPGLAHASVAMGSARLGDEEPVAAVPGARLARFVDMGNPHLVVLGEPVDDAVVAGLGPVLSRRHGAGANVEFVWAGDSPGELRLRVWERGVGETLACGTGACAAVAAAASWGLVDGHAVVHSPGGALEVTLDDDGIVLAGPTVHVADVEVAIDELAAMVQGLEPRLEVTTHP